MGTMKSNRLLPLLLVGSVAAVGMIGFVATSNPEPSSVPAGPAMAELPTAQLPDGDTASDTLKSVQAELASQRDETAGLKKQLAAAEESRAAAEAAVTQTRAEFKNELTQQQAQATADMAATERRLVTQITSLRDMIAGQAVLAPETGSEPGVDAPGEPVPVGGGLTIGGLDEVPAENAFDEEGRPLSPYIWLEPLSGPADASADLFADAGGLSPLPVSFDDLQSDAGATFQAAATAVQDGDARALTDAVVPDSGRPVFTIPNLSTLTGSTAFTAMIGRVPVAGQVRDPVRFRVLVGRGNLAASGLRVPADIISMVFEGTAIGDWTLGCVEGSFHTATFVFADGTIRTVMAGMGDNQARGQGGNGTGGAVGLGGRGADAQSGNQMTLGYISDRYGIPCVSGKRISNARGYLAGRVALASARAAADAAAASQTTQVVSPIGGGGVVSAVTGDTGEFVLGRAGAESIREVEQYLAERASDQFDVVFVEPGREVAILLTEEIQIDYEPNGRKLQHATLGRTNSRPSLD